MRSKCSLWIIASQNDRVGEISLFPVVILSEAKDLKILRRNALWAIAPQNDRGGECEKNINR